MLPFADNQRQGKRNNLDIDEAEPDICTFTFDDRPITDIEGTTTVDQMFANLLEENLEVPFGKESPSHNSESGIDSMMGSPSSATSSRSIKVMGHR